MRQISRRIKRVTNKLSLAYLLIFHIKNLDIPQEIDTAINKLDARVFNTYIEMKGEPLAGEIELGINQGEGGWDIIKPIQGE